MPFVKGQSGNPAGKKPGALSTYTKTIKETVLETFQALQNDPEQCLAAFAKKYPRDFHLLASKLIPTEMKAEVTTPEGIKVIFQHDPDSKPIGTNPEDNFGIPGEQGGL